MSSGRLARPKTAVIAHLGEPKQPFDKAMEFLIKKPSNPAKQAKTGCSATVSR
jgi:hypothetical protein